MTDGFRSPYEIETPEGAEGNFLQWLNPIPAGFDFLSRLLVSNQTFEEVWTLLESPFVFTVLVLGLLFLYAGPSLTLEAGRVSKLWSKMSRMAGLSVIVCLLLSLNASRAMALRNNQSQGEDLQITISMDHKSVKSPIQ